MASYNGARRKTTVGNRNVNLHSTETGAKNKNYSSQNGRSNGWGDIGKKPSRSTSDDGWGDIGRKPSGYTSADLWAPLPSQPAVVENAWERRGSKKNQRSHTNQGKRTVPLVGANFSWDDDDYPALESRPPVENVWAKRMEKLESRKAMEPTNMSEEEYMIQKAIELSKREAREEEEKRRYLEEEILLQNQILATNPDLFPEFMTPDELALANKSVEPIGTESHYQDFGNDYAKSETIWDYPEPVENQYSQKQDKKTSKKKKRNKSQSSVHTEDEITNQNAWSDSSKFVDEQNETTLPEQLEYQGTEDNWSQNPIGKNHFSKAGENESHFMGEDSGHLNIESTSTTLPDADSRSKSHKKTQPKISKVIDMFGGWGSKNNQNSSLMFSQKQEIVDSYEDFSSANSVPYDENSHDDSGKSKERPDFEDNLSYSQNSAKDREVNNFSTDGIGQPSVYEEDSWNNKYSSNDKQSSNEIKNSLYSHVESNIVASASAPFCNVVKNPSNPGASFSSKKPVPKDDDIMNNIVQDYASLAVQCSDSSVRENVPSRKESKDFFTSAATLLNDDNLKPVEIDFQHTSAVEPQSFSMSGTNLASNSEVTYSLNNTAQAEVSNKVPNENITSCWKDANINFPVNSERNETNNSLFLPSDNESAKAVLNDHENNPMESSIPAPIQRETPFLRQPNTVMGNFMDPSLMMGMNPLMMPQMMLNHPFFIQQLHYMQMHYSALTIPFNSPVIPPIPMAPFNPLMNNSMGNFYNNFPTSNMNPTLDQNSESNPSIAPPCYNIENESQRSLPSKSDAPNIEFDNSWLTELISEGAAHMDSFIPPPTMPATDSEDLHPELNVDKFDTNIVQGGLQNRYQNETNPQIPNCDKINPKQESPAMRYDQAEDVNANIRNADSNSTPQTSAPAVLQASGWGDIEMPKKNHANWNDDVDGWGDEAATTSKSMANQSRSVSQKQAPARHTIRQPRQTYQW